MFHKDQLDYISYLGTRSALTSFVLGAAIGARQQGLVFTAEHTLQEQVKNKKDWYRYFNWKYYSMMLSGIKQGTIYGLRFGGLVTVYAASDAFLDSRRGLLVENSPIAAGITGLTFGLIQRLGYRMTMQAGLFGVTVGSLISLVQYVDITKVQQQDFDARFKYALYQNKTKILQEE